MLRTLLCCLAFVLPALAVPDTPQAIATEILAPLLDPAKLATLGDRGANTRVQKITAILWQLKVSGHDPAL